MIQDCWSNRLAGLYEDLNLLLHDVGTFAPHHDVQSSDRQTGNQNCGSPRKSDDCHHLPANSAPAAAEDVAYLWLGAVWYSGRHGSAFAIGDDHRWARLRRRDRLG